MRPQILYLYVDLISTNPTYQHLPRAIAHLCRSNLRALDVSLADISQVRLLVQESDVVMFDGKIFSARWLKPPNKLSVAFSKWRGLGFYERVIETFLSSSAVKVLVSADDLHWKGPENWFLQYYPAVDAATWLYANKLKRREAVPEAWGDEWWSDHFDPAVVQRQVEHADVNLIDSPHCIKISEFKTPFRSRWDVCVPGVPYSTRRIAASSARGAGLSLAPYGRTESAAQMPRRLTPSRLFTPRALRFSNKVRYENVRSLVRASRLTYTDGSGYGYAVRKFFEIPAWGSPLVCLPHSGMGDFGFRPEWHYTPATPESFGEVAAMLLSSETGRNVLLERALEARRVVRTLHTCEARASQLIWAVEQFFKDRNSTCRWVDGQYISTPDAVSSSSATVWSPEAR